MKAIRLEIQLERTLKAKDGYIEAERNVLMSSPPFPGMKVVFTYGFVGIIKSVVCNFGEDDDEVSLTVAELEVELRPENTTEELRRKVEADGWSVFNEQTDDDTVT